MRARLSQLKLALEKESVFLNEVGRLYIKYMKEFKDKREEIEEAEAFITLVDLTQQKN